MVENTHNNNHEIKHNTVFHSQNLTKWSRQWTKRCSRKGVKNATYIVHLVSYGQIHGFLEQSNIDCMKLAVTMNTDN